MDLKRHLHPRTIKRLFAAASRRLSPILRMVPAQTPPSPLVADSVRDSGQSINHHSTADVARYYNQWTQHYLDGFGDVFQGSRPESTEELLDYIVDAAQLKDGMTVLDAGCGVCGPSIGMAKRRNVKIDAITISDVQVVEAEARIQASGLQERISVKLGDFHQLGAIFERGHFDRILFLESLCHAENYIKVLTEAKQVLKPWGQIYIKDFFAIDHRARPELIAQQGSDLDELNRIYCLMMPDIPRTVDIISGLGFEILYMRQPVYTYSSAPWENFMKKSNVYWTPKLGPDLNIRAIEFLLQSRDDKNMIRTMRRNNVI